MQDLGAAFGNAFQLLIALDPDLVEIVTLSLQVSLEPVLIAAIAGLPLGAAIACAAFAGARGSSWS